MRLPTFSKLGIAMTCDGPVVLPSVDEASEDKDRGDARHRFVGRAFKLGWGTALAEAPPEHRDELARMDLGAITKFFSKCGPVSSEEALALDPVACTARSLGHDIERGYEAAGADQTREVCGTTDLYAETSNREVVLVDMKGRARGDIWQLRAQAIAVARVTGARRVHAAFLHAQEDGSWQPRQVSVFDPLDLDLFECQIADRMAQWRRAAERAGKWTPDVSEGPHCDWCDSARYCPAKTALIRSASSLTLPQEVALLTNEERALAWRLVRKYKPALDKLDEALRASAALDPIDLGDRVVTEVAGREEIDVDAAKPILLQEFGGVSVMEKLIEENITKASIERVLGDRAEEALDRLRSAGAITRGSPSIREVKRR